MMIQPHHICHIVAVGVSHDIEILVQCKMYMRHEILRLLRNIKYLVFSFAWCSYLMINYYAVTLKVTNSVELVVLRKQNWMAFQNLAGNDINIVPMREKSQCCQADKLNIPLL